MLTLREKLMILTYAENIFHPSSIQFLLWNFRSICSKLIWCVTCFELWHIHENIPWIHCCVCAMLINLSMEMHHSLWILLLFTEFRSVVYLFSYSYYIQHNWLPECKWKNVLQQIILWKILHPHFINVETKAKEKNQQ